MDAQINQTLTFDRRLIYRQFLDDLNPSTLTNFALQEELFVRRPLDGDELEVHVQFADAAELSRRGLQMAIVGGIGSGKTTELLLARARLRRGKDAVSLYLDVADHTDLDSLQDGAILVSAGRALFHSVRPSENTPEIQAAHRELGELAWGKEEYVFEGDIPRNHDEYDGPDDGGPDDDGSGPVAIRFIPGLLKAPFPRVHSGVREIAKLVSKIANPLQQRDAAIAVFLDGLDRLSSPDRFWHCVEQDFRALKNSGISLVVAAPLPVWYDRSRALSNYFEEVRYLPAAIIRPDKSTFLFEILERRGALNLMTQQGIDSVCQFSGGVLRDLITIARSAAQYAYGNDRDSIGMDNITSAVRQLGRRYASGLGTEQHQRIARLRADGLFVTSDPIGRELLANRQVLDYHLGGQDSFAVHPALASVLDAHA